MAKKKDQNIAPEAENEKKTEAPDAEEYIGRVGVIGPEDVDKAMLTFQKYQEAKVNLDNRVIANEEWYRQRYCELRDKNAGGDEPMNSSAWLFNSILNKHADAMDNYPVANILPREQSDEESAKTLSAIVPIVMERANYEQIYSDAWDDKLIGGGSIQKIYWDNDLNNGLGDINIKLISVLNVAWEGGKDDIQDSPNFFHADYQDNDALSDEFPFIKDKLHSSADVSLNTYRTDDQVTRDNKTLVVDWYYKKTVGTKEVVHLCKFACGEVLWASENTEEYQNGYYEHGMYPFKIDSLFRLKGSPFGFGYVDVMKSPQFYIDKLDRTIIKNAEMVSKPRWFKKQNSNVNMEQFADFSRDFVDVDGNLSEEALRQIQINVIPNFVVQYEQFKVDELKETSGNRDFSQGATSAGVTSGSAIASLQEAGSKLSRDMIKASYRTYRDVVAMVVELMRQFYTEDRYFRVEGPNGDISFQPFNNSIIREQQMEVPTMNEDGTMAMEVSIRKPCFDFKISAQKQSPFSRTSQNETAKELYSMGIFNPQMADQAMVMLSMMDFEGIEKIRKTVSENAQMYNTLIQMTQKAMSLAGAVDQATGGLSNNYGDVAQIASQLDGQISNQGNGSAKKARPTGADGLPATDNTMATKARIQASQRSTPK